MQVLAQQSVINAGLKIRGTEDARILDGLVRRAVAALKKRFPEMGIITEIALDTDAIHYQGGLINNTGYGLNDESISHADVAVNGSHVEQRWRCRPVRRGGRLERRLEGTSHIHSLNLAYASKYDSSACSPFRDIIGSAPELGKGNKFTYQTDPAISDKSLCNIGLDRYQNADIVKSGMSYLYVIRRVKATYGLSLMHTKSAAGVPC